MAGMISRRPAAGVVAGLLFGALGLMLMGIRDARGLAAVLFTVSAWFFLAIGALAVLAGLWSFFSSRDLPR